MTTARPPVRVLLVDDSELVRCGVKAVLTAHGHPFITVAGEAGTAAGAVSECARLKPDVVLLDIRLPEIDGIEVLKLIKGIDESIEVIMVTAVITVSRAVEAIRLGGGPILTSESARLMTSNAVGSRMTAIAPGQA